MKLLAHESKPDRKRVYSYEKLNDFQRSEARDTQINSVIEKPNFRELNVGQREELTRRKRLRKISKPKIAPRVCVDLEPIGGVGGKKSNHNYEDSNICCRFENGLQRR